MAILYVVCTGTMHSHSRLCMVPIEDERCTMALPCGCCDRAYIGPMEQASHSRNSFSLSATSVVQHAASLLPMVMSGSPFKQPSRTSNRKLLLAGGSIVISYHSAQIPLPYNVARCIDFQPCSHWAVSLQGSALVSHGTRSTACKETLPAARQGTHFLRV